MLKLNIITGKKGSQADIPFEITEREFWEYYIRLLDIRPTGHSLTEKEIQIMTYILTGDPNKSYFKGPEGAQLRKDLRIQGPDLSKIKKILAYKNFIQETEGVRGDALPIPAIRNVQKYIKSAIEKGTLVPINFNFCFSIEEDLTDDKRDKSDIEE